MPDNGETAFKRATDFIEKCKGKGVKHVTIARKLFSFDHPHAFEGDHDAAFELFNKVANQFRVPIGHVKAVGSGQTGYSFFKQSPFVPKYSDLDLAIVDASLFQNYCETAYRVTRGYTDFTKFSRREGVDVSQAFCLNIARGYFRPDYMPNCMERDLWFRFFDGLSRAYGALFKNVNCGIYFSETFFEEKQSLVIDKYLNTKS